MPILMHSLAMRVCIYIYIMGQRIYMQILARARQCPRGWVFGCICVQNLADDSLGNVA